MDPLSITLAVVSLTTAIHDIVELGQRIYESFAKVSKNFRTAQCIAEDIKEMVKDIQNYYEDHKDALENMKDYRLALQDLLVKLRNFEASILPLLLQVGGRRQDRIIFSWNAWRHGNKIERNLLDLQSNIVGVIRRYIMNSSIRAEVKLEATHRETSKTLMGLDRDVAQGLEVLEGVRRDVSAIRLSTATPRYPYDSSSDEFDRNIIMFAQYTPSVSRPMLLNPDTVTEEFMTNAYIKMQINIISKTIEKMAILPSSFLHTITPNGVIPFQLTPLLRQASMNITDLRHLVVQEVTCIRGLFNGEQMQRLSIHEAAIALNELSVGLQTLGMSHESILVGKWAISLGRSLIQGDGATFTQLDLDAHVALYLLNQSVRYGDHGVKVQSLQLIEEAYTITRRSRSQTGQVRFKELYSTILWQYAQLVDNERSIEMLVEAVQMLEEILNVQAYTQSKALRQIETVEQPSANFLNRLFASTSPTPITKYARALLRLGSYMFKDGHSKIALDLQLLAIAIHRQMVFSHGPAYRAELAMAILAVIQGKISSCLAADEFVTIADECIQLLQELVGTNPLLYASRLVVVLWNKATALERLNRGAEGIELWKEIVMLTGNIIEDSQLHAIALINLSNRLRRLLKHDEAAQAETRAITTCQYSPEMQARRYLHLSGDLRQLRRYKESAEAARKSVALYRCLAMKDPGTWVSILTRSHSGLAYCLAASGEYAEALVVWKDSVTILENTLNTDAPSSTSLNDDYIDILNTYTLISYALEDEEQSLRVSCATSLMLQGLSERFSRNTVVTLYSMSAEFSYAYNMFRFGRLQEAQQHVDDRVEAWSRKRDLPSASKVEAIRAAMVLLKVDVLDAQGSTMQALSTNQQVRDIVKGPATTCQSCFSQIIDSMIHEARFLVDLGQSHNRAVEVTEEALQLCRENTLEPIVENMVWSLHAVALTALWSRSYRRAVDAAQEGYDVSASPDWLSRQGEHDIFVRPSLLAIQASAEANLGRYAIALEFARRAVDASLDIGGRKLDISASTSSQSLMETRGYLANILLVTGDIAEAREICEQRRAYFSERVERRMGEYRELAPILSMLGVLYCSEGYHKEGEAAARELSRIMNMLGSVFPSLQEQVKRRLRHQANTPILKVLDDMRQKLDCKHQAEVAAAFGM